MRFGGDRSGLSFAVLVTGTLIVALGACGSNTPSSGAGGSGASTTTTGAGGTATSTSGTGGASVPCGAALVCDPDQVCIVEDFDEPCGGAPEDGGTCPPGEHPTQCGGAGIPCCCGEAPPSTFHCIALPACDAGPSCACLGMVCPGDKWCEGIGGKPAEFHCVTPPMP